MANSKKQARLSQIEARDKEIKLQLKEAREIKEGWASMQEELQATKVQFNKLNVEHVATVALCRSLKTKNKKLKARIAELEALLAKAQQLYHNEKEQRELEKRKAAENAGPTKEELQAKDQLINELRQN